MNPLDPSKQAPTPQIQVPEITLKFQPNADLVKVPVTSSAMAAQLFRTFFDADTLALQEQFICLYLNKANHIIGYYQHSKGTMDALLVDLRLVMATALKCGAIQLIIAHNHPSGQLKPSEADQQLTDKLNRICAYHDLLLLDHLILTQSGYYSMKDEGLLAHLQQNTRPSSGMSGLGEIMGLSKGEAQFLEVITQRLMRHEKTDNPLSLKLARQFGISDKTQIKELTELALVRLGGYYARSESGPVSSRDRFDRLVRLYHNQMILAHRTSQSMILQQYSTPVPIGYLMGLYAGLPFLKGDEKAFEPSAGNGMLTIAADPSRVVVNEVDPLRRRLLQTQGFDTVMAFDASEPKGFEPFTRQFQAVLTNPPFGVFDKPIKIGSFPIRVLDHLMCIYALNTLADQGRAALIIGGHTKWDRYGRVQKGKNRIFLNYLYHHYEVEAVLQVEGRKLYTRQGTGFPVRLILIKGRKAIPQGHAPLFDPQKDTLIQSYEDLYERVSAYFPLHWTEIPTGSYATPPLLPVSTTVQTDSEVLEAQAQAMQDLLAQIQVDAVDSPSASTDSTEDLGLPYTPASNACTVLNTLVPDSMGSETHAALARIKTEVGGDMDNFVRHRLRYPSHDALCQALSAEQIDAVAMAIYNLEARQQGIIIGDQTGIGKGRIAAAMVRYGVMQGFKPVFLTEKVNLFSDLYRDLAAIGSAHLRPFIVNARDARSDIKDEDGRVIYQAELPEKQELLMSEGAVPQGYDFLMATYSQFNSETKRPTKPQFLKRVASDQILILDEAHNASGSGNTGQLMLNVVERSRGVVFLSATFAKSPDNMPLYAAKTSISEANMTGEMFVRAVRKGGVALQEILSSQMVAEGQMLRRERSFEGVEVNYLNLEAYGEEHKRRSDAVTEIIRDIIAFQKNHIRPMISERDKEVAALQMSTETRQGTHKAGVDNLPYFSKVFQVINQMLFSLKAEAVAHRAIERLQEGKKPVIAFSSTMGSFIESMENQHRLPVGEGDVIRTDFAAVLMKGLQGVLRYTIRDIDGEGTDYSFHLSELSEAARTDYHRIAAAIQEGSSGLNISPIDVIIRLIEQAGYRVAEVTGRKYRLELHQDGAHATVSLRRRMSTNDAFRAFNNNEVDVLMINQSGSTGASAHAIPTAKVKPEEVKQRVMLVLQAELDINTEVQKRGRINRTGQIHKPIYDYLISEIPAEKRLMMLLQSKLKSLDANTTSNQKQSTKILDVPDFLNKYGNQVVKEYLLDNPEVNQLLDNPLDAESPHRSLELAHITSGRVAVLSVKMQQTFYNEVIERYNELVEYLKQSGEYDLEVEALNLEALTLEKKLFRMGKGGGSLFATDSLLEKAEVNNLRKPYKKEELRKLLYEAGYTGSGTTDHSERILDLERQSEAQYQKEVQDLEAAHQRFEADLSTHPKLLKIWEKEGEAAYETALEEIRKNANVVRAETLARLAMQKDSRIAAIKPFLSFFKVGRVFEYPVMENDLLREKLMAVSLGVSFDNRRANPYAPSAIRVKMAIAGSLRFLNVPCSVGAELHRILAHNQQETVMTEDQMLSRWETVIATKSRNRVIRYIVTGNILQAFGSADGKLISYTTQQGTIQKGILLSEEFSVDETKGHSVDVPIARAYPVLADLEPERMIALSSQIKLLRKGEDFLVFTSTSRKTAGDVYTNPGLMELMEKGLFEKVGDKMRGVLPQGNLQAFLQILQDEFGISMEVAQKDMPKVLDAAPVRQVTPIALPPSRLQQDEAFKQLLELEAEAMLMELELLNL